MSSPQPQARLIGLTRPLQDVTVTAGETATFQCELSYEGIIVDWFLGETKLEPSDRVSSTSRTAAAFHFLLTPSAATHTRLHIRAEHSILVS